MRTHHKLDMLPNKQMAAAGVARRGTYEGVLNNPPSPPLRRPALFGKLKPLL